MGEQPKNFVDKETIKNEAIKMLGSFRSYGEVSLKGVDEPIELAENITERLNDYNDLLLPLLSQLDDEVLKKKLEERKQKEAATLAESILTQIEIGMVNHGVDLDELRDKNEDSK